MIPKIHQFDPVIYPYKIWVCSNRADELLSMFKINPDDIDLEFKYHHCATTYSVYRVKDGQIGILIVFSSKKQMNIKTIAHESRHAGDILFELIGDNPHHSEPAAYFSGWVAGCIEKVKLNKK